MFFPESVSSAFNEAELFGATEYSLNKLLDEVRKRKAIYIPPGPEGFNRLLLEFYDQDSPLSVVSVYFKPADLCYPPALLEKIDAHDLTVRRNQLALEAFKQQRLTFTEVLHEEAIWDLIRTDKDGNFLMYPTGVEIQDIAEHLSHLVYRLKTFSGYELILTKAWLPFYVVTYDIKSDSNPECFTTFYQRFNHLIAGQSSCLAVSDPLINSSISSNIIEWILTHPSTIREKGKVVSVLEQVRSFLLNEGPM